MLDLAPHNPYSLLVRHPVVARAGLRGAGIERLAHADGVGAILSDPLLRHDEPTGAWQATPAGVLWPNGGRSIGRARRDLARWGVIRRPVIVALQAASAAQLRELLRELDAEAHPAMCLDLTSIADPDTVRELVVAARQDWLKPILAELPLESSLPLLAVLDDVDALVIARGGVALGSAAANPVLGRVVGPAIHPMLLAATQRLREHTAKPLIIGAARSEHAAALLAGGATAVLLDVGLWHTPDLAMQVAEVRG